MIKTLRKICVITEEYPTETSPLYPFVDQLVCQMVDMGIDCTVLNPVSLTRKIVYRDPLKPKVWYKTTQAGNKFRIVCPRYFSFSTRNFGILNTSQWTLNSFMSACLGWFKTNHDYDAVYGHFIFPSAITASKVSEVYKMPSFLAYGENTTYTIDYLGEARTRELLKNINGVISVSTENKEILLEHDLFPANKIEVFPNGINNRKFFPYDKTEMRKKYNLPLSDFIVAFVGGFIHIKGPDRLSKAIEIVGSDKVKSLFLGTGNVKPDCQGILIQGIQPHDAVPHLLSAADIFVLPTLAEGCCNAIIEAMACGLPVISSDRPFNDDILDEMCSLRVDPTNIDEIAEAINTLLNNKDLRQRLAYGALEKAKQLSIEKRAERIIKFMESKM